MYNKLFTKILDSSIWLESMPTRIVWLTMIAAMDEHGFCAFASVANLAHRARVSLDEAREAVTCLESPDSESGDPDNDGRRIARIEGGWLVLNAEKYRQLVKRAVMQEQTRERVKRFRNGVKRECNAPVTPSDTDTEVQAEAKDGDGTSPAPPRRDDTMSHRDAVQAPGALAGTLPRDHLTHGWCGARFCVPMKSWANMVRQYGEGGEAAVTKFADTIDRLLVSNGGSYGGTLWLIREFEGWLATTGRVTQTEAKPRKKSDAEAWLERQAKGDA